MTEAVPPILYKYLPTERFDFFKKPKLRFSPPSTFNDIFDCAITSKIGYEDNDIQRLAPHITLDTDQKNIATQLIDNFYADFSKSCDETLSHELGVLSLAGDIENEAMWGLYATDQKKNAHRGFAIGLKTSHQFFTQYDDIKKPFLRLIKVEYTREIHTPKWADLIEKDSFYIFEYIFKKGEKWAFEDEWRMVTVPSIATNGKISGLVDIDIDMISGVYMGIKTPIYIINLAKLFCTLFDIPLFQMQCDRQTRTLRPISLATNP